LIATTLIPSPISPTLSFETISQESASFVGIDSVFARRYQYLTFLSIRTTSKIGLQSFKMKLSWAFVSSLALAAVASPVPSLEVGSEIAQCAGTFSRPSDLFTADKSLDGSSCKQLKNTWNFCNQYTGASAEANIGNCLCDDAKVR
jgi:hypothetical protein